MTHAQQSSVVVRRADRPGDLGWMVMANGETYAAQFGFDTDYEALVSRIVADFAASHDPAREAGWVAEIDGRRVGCIILAATTDPDLARLRVLVVTPEARGRGLGSRLVHECLDFAQAAGYRRVTLWTVDILDSARRIYAAAGFTLVAEKRQHSFGCDLVGQDWTLDLG